VGRAATPIGIERRKGRSPYVGAVGWPLDKLLDQLASPDLKRRRKAAQEMVETT
jgi:hypothetical protein